MCAGRAITGSLTANHAILMPMGGLRWTGLRLNDLAVPRDGSPPAVQRIFGWIAFFGRDSAKKD
jgi:hypothetical protein